MNKDKLEKMLLTYKAAEASYPFGPDARVFKVMGKMFALVSQKDQPPRVTLKCAPADAETLVSQFESVIPGYYMNKKHWITVSLTTEIPDAMLIQLVNDSYKRVVTKLTRAEKNKLANL